MMICSNTDEFIFDRCTVTATVYCYCYYQLLLLLIEQLCCDVGLSFCCYSTDERTNCDTNKVKRTDKNTIGVEHVITMHMHIHIEVSRRAGKYTVGAQRIQ
jgi:hypothetical protein